MIDPIAGDAENGLRVQNGDLTLFDTSIDASPARRKLNGWQCQLSWHGVSWGVLACVTLWLKHSTARLAKQFWSWKWTRVVFFSFSHMQPHRSTPTSNMKRENYAWVTLHSIPTCPHELCMVLEQVKVPNFRSQQTWIHSFLVLTRGVETHSTYSTHTMSVLVRAHTVMTCFGCACYQWLW